MGNDRIQSYDCRTALRQSTRRPTGEMMQSPPDPKLATVHAPKSERAKVLSAPRIMRAGALLLWLSLAAAIWWYAASCGLNPVELVGQAIEILKGRTALAAAVYIVAYAVRPFFFFSAAVLTLAGGFLFGPWLGFGLTVIAANLSASVAYGIGRAFGQGLLHGEQSNSLVFRWAQRMRSRAFETVLVMRFLLVPYDAVSYLAGLLRLSFPAFVAATALGSLTGTAQFVLIGASLEHFTLAQPSVNLSALAASFVFLAIGLGLSRYARRREDTTGTATDVRS